MHREGPTMKDQSHDARCARLRKGEQRATVVGCRGISLRDRQVPVR